MLFPKKYHSAVVAAVLILISLIILSFNLKRSKDAGFFRKVIMEMASPFEYAIDSAIQGAGNAWKRYIFLVGLEEENRNLKKKIDVLTNEIVRYREGYLEGLRLKEHLSLREKGELPMVTARVISKEGTSVFKTILVNKGSVDGIKVGLPVLSPEGIVGRVVEVSWNSSRVLLITDFNSNIDALIQGSRSQGVLQGGGATGCILKYVERSEEIKIGDPVLTSGLGGVFPKGLLLGTVVNVDRKSSGLFQKIDVFPAVYFSRLEEVSIVLIKGNDQ